MTSRTALLLALLLLAGCSGSRSGLPLGSVEGYAATNRARGHKSTSPISHVIVIVQENRAFDELFQAFPGANTQSFGMNHLGQQVPLTQVPINQKFGHPHGHPTFVTETDYNQSTGQYRMDGFDYIADCGSKPSCAKSVYTYVRRADVQNYWTYAKQYAIGDMTFQPNMGPSWAAHQYLIAGQTGAYTSSLAALYADPSGHTTCGNALKDYPTLDMTQPYPGVAGPPQPSCVSYPTIFDELDSAGIGWRYYARSKAGFWTAPSSVQTLWSKDQQNVSVPSTNVLGDIANHALAPVSYVTPGDAFSDHPYKTLTNHGQDWLALIANAVGSDPYYWDNTVIVLTWDDWGGFYDHVPPPFAANPAGGNPNPNEYGMRVGFIVIGAYVIPGVVDHTVRSSVAILTFIENTFGLPSLGTLDAQQDNLSGLFDFARNPNVYHRVTTHGWNGKNARADEIRDPSPIDDDMP